MVPLWFVRLKNPNKFVKQINQLLIPAGQLLRMAVMHERGLLAEAMVPFLGPHPDCHGPKALLPLGSFPD